MLYKMDIFPAASNPIEFRNVGRENDRHGMQRVIVLVYDLLFQVNGNTG